MGKNIGNTGRKQQEMEQFLEGAVRDRHSIFISGKASLEKDTFLQELSARIQTNERAIYIGGDPGRLRERVLDLVTLERHPDMVRTAMRMRPDRIIIQEIEGNEASDVLTGISIGYSGTIACIDSDGPQDMLDSLRRMVSWTGAPGWKINALITDTIDLIVHFGELEGRGHGVLQVIQMLGYWEGTIRTQCLYDTANKDTDRMEQPLVGTGKRLAAACRGRGRDSR